MARALKIWKDREKKRLRELYDQGASTWQMAKYFRATSADIFEGLGSIGITRTDMILRGAK